MKRLKQVLAIASALVALLIAGCTSPPQATRPDDRMVARNITIACGSSAADREFCAQFAEEWGKKTGYTVKLYSPPARASVEAHNC